MSKKLGKRIARLGFWHTLHQQFLEFETLLSPIDELTPEDRAALKEVHRLVYEAYLVAKDRKREHLI